MLLFHRGTAGHHVEATPIHMDDLMGNSVLAFLYLCYGVVVLYTMVKGTHSESNFRMRIRLVQHTGYVHSPN